MFLRPIHVASLLLLVTLVLAGCRTVPFEPPIAATFDAQVLNWPGGTPEPQASGLLLPAGRTLYYAIEFGEGRRDLLFAEVVADGPLQVSLLNARGGTLARSTSKEVFPSDATGGFFTAADDELAPRSISAEFTCLGPCAAIRAIQSMVYIAVENKGSSTRTFDLYAFTMPFSDLNEPNDGPETATPVSGPGTVSGAIETIGDVDWFVMGGNSVREVTFFPTSDELGLRLRIQGSDVSLRYGETAVLYPGERFTVASSMGRAGPSATSGYAVELGTAIASDFDQIVDAVDSSSPPKLVSRSIAGGATRSYLVRLPTPGARPVLHRGDQRRPAGHDQDAFGRAARRLERPRVLPGGRRRRRRRGSVDRRRLLRLLRLLRGAASLVGDVPRRGAQPDPQQPQLRPLRLRDGRQRRERPAEQDQRRARHGDQHPGRGQLRRRHRVGRGRGLVPLHRVDSLIMEFTVLDEALGIELVFSAGTSGEEPPIRGETDGVTIPLFPEDVFRVPARCRPRRSRPSRPPCACSSRRCRAARDGAARAAARAPPLRGPALPARAAGDRRGAPRSTR
jgi:hypothetical protein